MATGWIKVDVNLPEKPEVIRLARLLKISRFEVVGILVRFWSWLDQNTVDGVVDAMETRDVDDIVAVPGFGDALIDVKWLRVDVEGGRIVVPNFARHNGESAKNRALKAERQTRWRQGVASTSASTPPSTPPSTAPSTREDKRRNKSKGMEPAFELPSSIPADAWQAYEEMRKTIGKPMTTKAKRMIVEKLERLRAQGHDPRTVLEASVMHTWIGVFPPRPESQPRAVNFDPTLGAR